MKLTPEALDRLGVRSQPVRAYRIAEPVRGAKEAEGELEALVGDPPTSPATEPVGETIPWLLARIGCLPGRWKISTSIFTLRLPHDPGGIVGVHKKAAGILFIDARKDPAWVHVRADESDAVLEFAEDGEISVILFDEGDEADEMAGPRVRGHLFAGNTAVYERRPATVDGLVGSAHSFSAAERPTGRRTRSAPPIRDTARNGLEDLEANDELLCEPVFMQTDELLSVDLPPLAAIAPVTDQAWLSQQYERARMLRSPLLAAVAIGTVARLWSSSFGAVSPENVLQLAPHSSSLQRARAWARTLAPEIVVDIVNDAILEAHRLEDELPKRVEAFGQDRPMACERIVRWMIRRDNLASVQAVLVGVGADRKLNGVLESLDQAAADSREILLEAVGSQPPERLQAVAWQYPEAWWGVVAVQPSSS